jgi:geranylgeranyl transferase type-1 subunit beta
VGALSFLERTEKGSNHTTILSPQSQRFDSLLKWLLSRQTHEMEEDDDDEDEDDEADATEEAEAETSPRLETHDTKDTTTINDQIEQLPDILPFTPASLTWTGFNGRLNKIADTCYCFWVTGALGVRTIFISNPLLY